jgi:hypothetical protein
MTSLLMQAAQSAAQADGLAPPTLQSMSNNANNNNNTLDANGKKKGPPLRRGKWTPEEEAYANRLIQEFKAGLLPLTDGTTLRTFLSKLLNCDPMRISKKFVGSNCIGKQVFRRRTADLNRLTPEQIQQSRVELSEYVLVTFYCCCCFYAYFDLSPSFIGSLVSCHVSLCILTYTYIHIRLERRFLERVAQTNRVKSTGVGTPTGTPEVPHGGAPKSEAEKPAAEHPPSPPWLQPPLGYKPGNGAAFAAAHMASNPSAAAAGRALLSGSVGSEAALKAVLERKASEHGLSAQDSANFLAVAELQRRASQQNMLQNALSQSSGSNSLFGQSQSNNAFSSSAMAQLAQSASGTYLLELYIHEFTMTCRNEYSS